MGYAQYVLPDGREAGYAVGDVCNFDSCTTSIDRGLDYVCGATPGGDEYGCGRYFCGSHLSSGPVGGAQQCHECRARYEQEHPHSFPDAALIERPDGTREFEVSCRCGEWSMTGPDTAVLEEQHSEHEVDAEGQR